MAATVEQNDGERHEAFSISEGTGWVPAIERILHTLSEDGLFDEWTVRAGLYENGVRRSPDPYIDETDFIRRHNFAQFVYSPVSGKRDTWMRFAQHFWIGYHVDWKEEYSVDRSPYAPRLDGPKMAYRMRTDRPCYVVGGLLADPIVTSSVETVIEHLNHQLSVVAARIEYNADLSYRLARRVPGDETLTPSSPLRHLQFDEHLIGRLARHFGVYSNILLYDADYLTAQLLDSHADSGDDLYRLIEETVEEYRTARSTSSDALAFNPDDLAHYPKGRPVDFAGSRWKPHTHSEGTDATPLNYRRGLQTDITWFGEIDSVRVGVRADGYWLLTTSTNGDDLIIPFGTERYECRRFYAQTQANPNDAKLYDCYVALRVLTENCTWEQDVSTSTTPVMTKTLLEVGDYTPDMSGVRTIESRLDTYLQGVRGWSPTVWSSHLYSHTRTGWPSEIIYLLDSLSTDMVAGWVVSTRSRRSGTVEFRYKPETLKETRWIQETNFLRISFSQEYPAEANVDTPTEDETGQEEKYLVECPLNVPYVTGSIGRLLAHLEHRFAEIATIAEQNADIERIHTAMSSPNSRDDQLDFLLELPDIGERTVREIARAHGSYLSLLNSDELRVLRWSDEIEFDLQTVQGHIRPAAETYKQEVLPATPTGTF